MDIEHNHTEQNSKVDEILALKPSVSQQMSLIELN